MYGFFHNITLTNAAAARAAQAKLARENKLVEEAKQKWRQLHPRPVDENAFDIDSPQFDAEKAISSALALLG